MMSISPRIRYNDPVRTCVHVVEKDRALALASVTFDEEPTYNAGEAVPPLYTSTMDMEAYFECLRVCIPEGVYSDQTGGAHAESDVYFHKPLRPGDRLTWSPQISAVQPSPAGALETMTLVYLDDVNEPVITHLWTSISIGATTDQYSGEKLPDHKFPEDARERPLGGETIFLPETLGEAYFEASGDHAAHSRDLEAALAEGFPGLILQGMCTFGISAGVATRFGGGGDSSRMTRLAARFTSPVLLGHDLTVDVFEIASHPDGSYEVAFEAHQGDTYCVRHGRAVFGPAT
jgi:acyl dehydratase